MNTNPTSPAPSGRFQNAVRLTATPLTIATFGLCGGTGLALFLDVHSHAVKSLHEWSGLAMLAAVGLHLLRNWSPTVSLFRRWPMWTALGGAAVAAIWMLAVPPASAAPRQERERGGERSTGPDQRRAEGAGRDERRADCDGDCERERGDGRRHDGHGRGLRRGDGDGPRHDGSGRDRD